MLYFDFAKYAFFSRLHAFTVCFYYNSLWRKCKFWRGAFWRFYAVFPHVHKNIKKYKKVWHFLRKTLDICLRFGYNNTRRQGHGSRRKEYADVAELADALDSGSSSLKRVWVQIPSSAPKSSNVSSGIFCCIWIVTPSGGVKAPPSCNFTVNCPHHEYTYFAHKNKF